MKKPTLSIGVPVYNGARYLPATLDSLLAQTFSDFEIIISDNASTDDTELIGREYAARDQRVRYHRAPVNLGAPANYRRAYELGVGDYFKWQNADDVIAPTFVERCMDVARADPGLVLVYTKSQLVDEHGGRLADVDQDIALASPSPSARFLRAASGLTFCNVIYGVMPRHAIAQTALLGAYINSDLVLVAELALLGRFHEIPEILFSRRIHPSAYASIASLNDKLAFYKPSRKNQRIALPRWRMLREYALVIARSRLSLPEKLEVAIQLLRVTNWQRAALLREAWHASTALGGSLTATGKSV